LVWAHCHRPHQEADWGAVAALICAALVSVRRRCHGSITCMEPKYLPAVAMLASPCPA
jgi:hypothetical protein